jgi:hypothetical protein
MVMENPYDNQENSAYSCCFNRSLNLLYIVQQPSQQRSNCYSAYTLANYGGMIHQNSLTSN